MAEYGVLSSGCSECLHVDTCNHTKTKDEVAPGAKPCRKWEFDKRLVEPEPDEDTQVEAEKITQQVIDDIGNMPDSTAETIVKAAKRSRRKVRPDGESKADSFKRLAASRLAVIEKQCQLLGNLGYRYHSERKGTTRFQYDYTQEQADAITEQLAHWVISLKQSLQK